MLARFRFAVPLMLCWQLAAAGPASIANSVPDQPQDLVGHYYLTGGSETGSELLLNASGEFAWSLSYGVVDLGTRGTWRLVDQSVVLTPYPPQAGRFRLFAEDELSLRKPAAFGTWVAIVGIPHVGPLGDVEVCFESQSGRQVTAVSLPNGDAIVTMPSSESWRRAGLRRAGSQEPWAWVDVSEKRSRARIAGFAVMNLQEMQGPPFVSLPLIRKGAELLIDDERSGLRGVYQKQP